MMRDDTWQNLVIERQASPRRLTDDEFRRWLENRPVFVSSTMDDEMTPARESVRAELQDWGADPVMWEELAPRDQRPDDAYLDGVERSRIFILLLGHRYGREDARGYSPTHKEANRAAQLHIPRLLLQPDGISSSRRDGKLNDWVGSLYTQVSGNRYASPDDLRTVVVRQLREMASAQETPWIMLGRAVFPGRLRRRAASGQTVFTVTATVRSAPVRRHLAELGDWRGHGTRLQLCSGLDSWTVSVEEVVSESATLSADEVEIVCALERDQRSVMTAIHISTRRRQVTPADQSRLWADLALFGTPASEVDGGDLSSWIAPDGPTLPDVLVQHQARGWMAEGLVRLYAVDRLTAKYGGRIEHIDVGPSTATGIRLAVDFRPDGFDPPLVHLSGIVPL